MKLAIVGVGDAGCRITESILQIEKATGRDLCNGNTLLINTTQSILEGARHVPEDRRLLIGDVHREVNGNGIDGDPDLGAQVARDERNEIIRDFDLIDLNQVDGVMVVAGLGRGTGGGAGPVVIDELQAICDKPVYALVVLPDEEEAGPRALNASRSLRSMVEKADNVIAFDNDAWRTDGGSAEQDHAALNDALATRIVTLFAAGEIGSPTEPENRMDPSDIIRTLDTGGISSIGYAETDVSGPKGLLTWFRRKLRGPGLPWRASDQDGDDEPTDAVRIQRLVHRAVRSQLTLPCDVSSADRALIMLSGPPWELSRIGFESSRYWLEQEADTVEVLAGDEPHDQASKLTAVVLLSNVTEVPRIERMQEAATRQETEVPSQ